MRLTKKKALDISIELWEWLAEDGSRRKSDWPGWGKYGGMRADCPLCEYTSRAEHRDQISLCRYTCLLKGCYSLSYGRWALAEIKSDRKKYAGLFLEQLKEKREATK